MKFVTNLFCKHPEEQGESYWQHALFAFSIATHFAISSLCLFIHGFLPFICPPKPFDLESTKNLVIHKCNGRKQINKK